MKSELFQLTKSSICYLYYYLLFMFALSSKEEEKRHQQLHLTSGQRTIALEKSWLHSEMLTDNLSLEKNYWLHATSLYVWDFNSNINIYVFARNMHSYISSKRVNREESTEKTYDFQYARTHRTPYRTVAIDDDGTQLQST